MRPILLSLLQNGFILIFFILLLSFSPSKAQVISSEIYETEEDLEEGLLIGELTLDEYLELLDLIRSPVNLNAEELSKLLFVPDLSIAEIDSFSTPTNHTLIQDKTNPFTRSDLEKEKRWNGEFIWQMKEKFQEDEHLQNYFRFQIKNQHRFSLNWEGEQNGGNNFLFRRRSLEISHLLYLNKVILGTFEKKMGLGLNLGYHPYFSYTIDSAFNFKDSFLYPLKGRYNGIYLESQFNFLKAGFLFSKNKFATIENDLYALDLNYDRKSFKTGLVFSEGKFNDTKTKEKYMDDCLSFYFDLRKRKLKLSSEYATLLNGEKGWATNFWFKEKLFWLDVSGWWYSKDFIHPYGSGISNPDYETVYLLEDLSYRDRQRGERGAFFKSKYQLTSKSFLDFAYTQWRKNEEEDEKIKTKFGGGYIFSKKVSSQLHILVSDDVEEKGTDYFVYSWDTKFYFEKKSHFRLRTNYRVKKLTFGQKRYGDVQLKFQTKRFSPFDLTFWLKYSDPDFSASEDVYWDFYFQEKIEFLKNYSLSFGYWAKFYQDENRLDTKGFKARLEIEW